VGGSAQVRGDIVAREVVVSGEVTGNVTARDRIEIKKGGSVVGDLSTARLAIEDGAYYKGSIEIESRMSKVGADLGTLLTQAKPAEIEV
jgi:cytoskeletal protein CcmA (bactofilin family)